MHYIKTILLVLVVFFKSLKTAPTHGLISDPLYYISIVGFLLNTAHPWTWRYGWVTSRTPPSTTQPQSQSLWQSASISFYYEAAPHSIWLTKYILLFINFYDYQPITSKYNLGLPAALVHPCMLRLVARHSPIPQSWQSASTFFWHSIDRLWYRATSVLEQRPCQRD